MDLAKLFETQRILDNRIYDRFPELKGQNNLDWKILALLVELGECANKWRGFKKWSKDQEPRLEVKCHACEGLGEFHHQIFLGNEHVDDGVEGCMYCGGTGIQERPLLEEYVDCLHFILSIGLELALTDIEVWKIKEKNITNQFIESTGRAYNLYFQLRVTGEIPKELYEHLFSTFVGLGEMLGFTWEKIEQAYYAKNAINHQRQAEGY